MKVAIVSTVAQEWGGSEELWYQFAFFCKEKGIEVHIFLFERDFKFHKWQLLFDAGFHIHKIPLHQTIKNSSFIYKLIRILFRIPLQYKNRFSKLASSDWDKIIINQGGASDLLYYHDLYDTVLASKAPYIVLNHGQKETLILSMLERSRLKEIFQKAHYLLFVSNRNLKNTERFLVTEFPKAILFKNPVNYLSQSPLPWPKQPVLHMAFVARMDLLKGYDVLFAALTEEHWQVREYVLNIYGDGPDEDYIRDLIRFYKLSDKVFIRGFESNATLIWQHNHLLVLPSLAEGMPLVLIEAALAGRPAVCSDVGGCAEFTTDKISGFISPAGSVTGLLEVLEEMWLNKASLQTMGLEAQKRAMVYTKSNPVQFLYNKVCYKDV